MYLLTCCGKYFYYYKKSEKGHKDRALHYKKLCFGYKIKKTVALLNVSLSTEFTVVCASIAYVQQGLSWGNEL